MNNNRTYRLTIGLIFTYTVLVVVSIIFHKYIPLANGYIWNIFLALLPLLCALLIDFLFYEKNSPVLSLLVGIIWLILFPNSPYMVTDLAHLNLYHVSYGLDISTLHSAWFGVLFATFAIITGVLMGMLSFYTVFQIIREKFSSLTAWGFSIIVSLLAGFGVFLGRFPRFNSWDVIKRPSYLFKIALDQINSHTLGFVILFSTMTFALYWLFYLIFDVSAKSDKL
ncbi:DUF1361 domain-containing protein [Oenococcus sp. UCMA 17063]|nr:DUF1361 domain-containing protein [Oenococcus sp. UCMA 17063]